MSNQDMELTVKDHDHQYTAFQCREDCGCDYLHLECADEECMFYALADGWEGCNVDHELYIQKRELDTEDEEDELREFMEGLGFRHESSDNGYLIHAYVANRENPSSLNSVLTIPIAKQLLADRKKHELEARIDELTSVVQLPGHYSARDYDASIHNRIKALQKGDNDGYR